MITFLILLSNNSVSLKWGIIIFSILLFLFPIISLIELSKPWIKGWILIGFLLGIIFLKFWKIESLFLILVVKGIIFNFFGFFNCFSIDESKFFFIYSLSLLFAFLELLELIVSKIGDIVIISFLLIILLLSIEGKWTFIFELLFFLVLYLIESIVYWLLLLYKL